MPKQHLHILYMLSYIHNGMKQLVLRNIRQKGHDAARCLPEDPAPSKSLTPSSSSASLSQHSLPLTCFCRTCAVSSLTTNCTTRRVHSNAVLAALKQQLCFAAAGQGLVSPPAWLGGGSIRSLNPSFSRGSLVISWLENTREQRELSSSDEMQHEITPVNRFRDYEECELYD